MGEGAGALERLITELSATFINLPAEAIDGRIEQAMGLIAEFARADRVTVGQLQEGGRTFSRTHQWVREGFQRIEGEEPVEPYPWASRRVFVDREPLVLSRLDDLPPEAARDRRSFERLGSNRLSRSPSSSASRRWARCPSRPSATSATGRATWWSASAW